jgi:hypothetical protein
MGADAGGLLSRNSSGNCCIGQAPELFHRTGEIKDVACHLITKNDGNHSFAVGGNRYMIITHLYGGLGNQMFQYAVARRIAYHGGEELKLDITIFAEYPLRVYELKYFQIEENFATQEEIAKLKYNFFNRLKPLYKRTYIKEKHFQYTPQISKLRRNVYLEGYWQTERYFKDIEDIIRKDFTVKTPLAGSNLEIAKKISEVDAVSVHIRRGDYVANPTTNEIHGVCGLSYYYDCIAKLASKINNPHFFVFSDDQEWVQENLKISFPVTFITQNGAEKAYEDLRLMSLCKHHIIANSSFSWWGAWLAPGKDKIVYAPSRWFNLDIDTSDLLPAGWIKV